MKTQGAFLCWEYCLNNSVVIVHFMEYGPSVKD